MGLEKTFKKKKKIGEDGRMEGIERVTNQNKVRFKEGKYKQTKKYLYTFTQLNIFNLNEINR